MVQNQRSEKRFCGFLAYQKNLWKTIKSIQELAMMNFDATIL
jgi:hypothetical protein